MKDSLILQDKKYISAKRVHELFGYTSDYVGQLCRSGKLDSKMVGRSWFVTEQSIIDYKLTLGDSPKSENKEKKSSKKRTKKTSDNIENKAESSVQGVEINKSIIINDNNIDSSSNISNENIYNNSNKNVNANVVENNFSQAPELENNKISEISESNKVIDTVVPVEVKEFKKEIERSINKNNELDLKVLDEKEKIVIEENKIETHTENEIENQAKTNTENKINSKRELSELFEENLANNFGDDTPPKKSFFDILDVQTVSSVLSILVFSSLIFGFITSPKKSINIASNVVNKVSDNIALTKSNINNFLTDKTNNIYSSSISYLANTVTSKPEENISNNNKNIISSGISYISDEADLFISQIYNKSYNLLSSASLGVYLKVSNVFSNTVSNIYGFLAEATNQAYSIVNHEVAVKKSEVKFNGLAVAPSVSENDDYLLKQKINDSFSDEVKIKPDQSGTAGVITPVFKKTKGNDFVYVLVPVKDADKNKENTK